MGTRADFYIKKADEPELVWIASIAWDGYPDGIDKEILNAKSQTDYIASLQKFISKRDDVAVAHRSRCSTIGYRRRRTHSESAFA
jgi:hypothetical protein